MYEGIEIKKQYAGLTAAQNQCGGQLADMVDRNPTVGENIDTRIAHLVREIERLEESKKTLGPLLDMKIRDIRDAMNY